MTIEKIVEHHWKPMEEFILKDEDLFDWTNGNKIGVLKKLKPNQYIQLGKVNVTALNLVLDNLKEDGLNIGKGNCEYGYKMPLPQNGNKERELIIFRRY